MKTKTLQLIMAVFLVILGAAMITFAIFTEPRGEIHNSVLVAFGEMLTFAGSVFGLDYNYKYKVFKKDREEENVE